MGAWLLAGTFLFGVLPGSQKDNRFAMFCPFGWVQILQKDDRMAPPDFLGIAEAGGL